MTALHTHICVCVYEKCICLRSLLFNDNNIRRLILFLGNVRLCSNEQRHIKQVISLGSHASQATEPSFVVAHSTQSMCLFCVTAHLAQDKSSFLTKGETCS